MTDELGGEDQICDTELGLGFYPHGPNRDGPWENVRIFSLDLSLNPNDRGTIELSPGLKNGRGEEEEEKEQRKRDDDRINSESCMRRKLRLSRDQTTLLEDSFRQQSTLTMVQKNILAEKLNLKPRQVEVWFQNRRARTKLKQTEVDCKFWRKNCERLMEENRRLSKELFELRSTVKIEKPSMAPAPPCFILYSEGGRKVQSHSQKLIDNCGKMCCNDS